jgi:L-lactate dehydrogenase complex protein LldG
MNSRNTILASLRGAQRKPATLPEVPIFEAGLPPALAKFKETFAGMGGIWADRSMDRDLDAQIRERFPDAKVICSTVPEVAGTRRIEQVRDPHELNDVDVGIVRPRFAVAETGSIWLSEVQYQVNALGYLSQHLVALLDPADIVGNLHHAYHRSDFLGVNYAVLMSGPSATADIEGILIRGAQGIRSLTVIPVARGAS